MTSLYRALLRLYPASFRADYAAELERAYQERVRESGRFGAVVAAVADVIPNALAAHWSILSQDLRYAARSLAGSRGFAIATILVTALGVGANTATFSVADFVLVRPLPYKDPDALVRLCAGMQGLKGWGCQNQMPPAIHRDVVTANRSFESVGAFTRRAVNVVGTGEPIRVSMAAVTGETLPILGVSPLLGRLFETARMQDDAQTVVISFGLWQSQFGGDPGVVGKGVNLDGSPFTVIGVMPAHFRFPTADVQLWMPLVLREEDYANVGNNYLEGIARLKPNVTFEQASADLTALAARVRTSYADDWSDFDFSFFRQRDEMSPRYKMILWSLCGASLAMLLLTCANLANLSLARAAGRERELAVRAALGAGRERLVRQMLTESVLLALIGGISGALLAMLSVPLLARLVPSTLPLASQPSVDIRVFAIAIVFAALTAIGFGLLPALRAGGGTGFAALREGTRGSAQRQRLRTALVATEVSVSVALLIASGLLIRAIWRVQDISPGFSAERILTVQTALPRPKYEDPAVRGAFYDRVLAGVRALPGIQSAAYVSGLPMVMTGGITGIRLPGEDNQRGRNNNTASLRVASPQFFATMQIPLRQGRDVSETDTRDRQLVAVVSESFARRHWPNADPIGRIFEVRGQERAVVGVVGDIRVRGLERNSEPQLYLPMHQTPPLADQYQPRYLLVRSAYDGPQLLPAVREIVRQVDPQQPLSEVRMLTDIVGDQTATRRTQIRVLGALAVLALLLAGVGIHGLLAFTVAQRDREIGVRLALGAEPTLVARMIISEGVRMALIGVVPGVLIAYAAARGMSALLFGVEPSDPLTITAAVGVCFMIAALGCVRPAVRAARIDPITALKAE